MSATQLLPLESSHDHWDGVTRGYIPGPRLRISPALPLHSGDDEVEVDPITFEVVRYTLLNANFEHSALIQKLCVSPITMLTRDFQASILTEIGDLVFLGPNLQYFSNSHELTIKWILEHRSENPGIHEGDMFLSNDPYVGAPHQPDAAVCAPVFVDGELFCWVANIMHHADVGGVMAGSFCTNARDMFDDPPALPPIKLVERGEIRADVEQMFMRQSRLPSNVLMDVRAAIAANLATVAKITSLVTRYGADVVKSVMRRTIDASELQFVELLDEIPDGTWSHRMYTEASMTGDRGIYRYQINITKEGGRLVIDNEGTDPQTGAINTTYVAWAGATLAALTSVAMSDLSGAYGGVYRRVGLRPTSGTLSCADFPAAVSIAGAYTTMLLISLAAAAVDKMLLCGTERARSRIIGPSFPCFYSNIYVGQDANDEFYVMPNTNGMMGAIAAMYDRDGIDSGGHFWIPEGVAFNVEQIEHQYPALYLFRRMLQVGADGAGRYRGGLGFEEGCIPWGGSEMVMNLYMNEGFPKVQGVAGANPASRGSFSLRTGSRVRQAFAQGSIPQSVEEMGGTEIEGAVFKGPELPVGPDDAWTWTHASAAGFGDPLLRDPALVQRDIEAGVLDVETATRVYGVVFAGDEVDVKASPDRQLDQRRRRLGT